MVRSRFTRPLALLAVFECIVFMASFLTGWAWLTSGAPLTELTAADFGRMLGACALMVVILFALGLYNWRGLTGYIDMAVRLAAALGLAYVLYGALAYLVAPLRLPATPMLAAFLLAGPVMFLLRLAFIRLTNLIRFKTRILVLGTGNQAAQIEELETGSPQSRFRVEAYIDVEGNAPAVPPERILRAPNDLAELAERKMVDEVVLALEERRGRSPLQELVTLRLRGFAIADYQDFMERVQGCIDVDNLRPSWFFQSGGFRSSPAHRAAKRVFDVAISIFILLFTLPLLLLTAIAIRLESPGPVFYLQERIGRGGRAFVLIKFRSMRNDAESAATPQWAAAEDPRITRVGAIIRKTRIDELPQVLNVLKGDMSFVGPRPERPHFVNLLNEQIPFYQERHSVRPGITGWAQLNYPYGASIEDAKYKLEYDLFYIKYFDIVFDLSIALQTARVILWPEGVR